MSFFLSKFNPEDEQQERAYHTGYLFHVPQDSSSCSLIPEIPKAPTSIGERIGESVME